MVPKLLRDYVNLNVLVVTHKKNITGFDHLTKKSDLGRPKNRFLYSLWHNIMFK